MTTLTDQRSAVQEASVAPGGSSFVTVLLGVIVMIPVLFGSGFVSVGNIQIASATAAAKDFLAFAIQAHEVVPGITTIPGIAKDGAAKPKPATAVPTSGNYGWTDAGSSWHSKLPSAAGPFIGIIEDAAKSKNVDPRLVAALFWYESGFQPRICSGKGACGLGQLMPGTATGLGVTDRSDPYQNAQASARYIRIQLNRFGRLDYALAAYNAGPGAVTRYGGIPPYPDTIRYVPDVTRIFVKLGGKVSSGAKR